MRAERITEAVFARSQVITEYRILRAPDVDLDRTGAQPLAGSQE